MNKNLLTAKLAILTNISIEINKHYSNGFHIRCVKNNQTKTRHSKKKLWGI